MTKLPEAQKVDRYKNRRKMAWLSFWFIAFGGVGLTLLGLSSDVFAERINTLSFILGTVFGVWVSVVLAYFGATAYTDGQNQLTEYETDGSIPDVRNEVPDRYQN